MTTDQMWKRYREEVIDRNENEVRLLYLYRQEMITNAQLHRELEIARETIETLLSTVSVGKTKTGVEE